MTKALDSILHKGASLSAIDNKNGIYFSSILEIRSEALCPVGIGEVEE